MFRVLLLSGLFYFGWAQSSSLQRALHLFEIEGRYTEAKNQLEEIIRDSSDNYLEAHFHLARIYEFIGQKQFAVPLYEVIYNSSLASEVYSSYSAGRLAELSHKPLKKITRNFKQILPISAYLKPNNGLFLQNNHRILRIKDDNISYPFSHIPTDLKILFSLEFSVIALNPQREAVLVPYYSNIPIQKLPIASSIEYAIPLKRNTYFITTADSIYYMNLQTPEWVKSNPYPDCIPKAHIEYTQELAFLCPEGSVRLLDLKTGSPSSSLVLGEEIINIFSSDGGLNIQTAAGIYFFQPGIDVQYVWKRHFRRLKDVAYFQRKILIHTSDGKLIALNAANGKELWRIHVGFGKLYTSDYNFHIMSSAGDFLTYSPSGQYLWTYHSRGELSLPPVNIKNEILLAFKDGRVIFLNAMYRGLRYTQSDALLEEANSLQQNDPIQFVSKIQTILKSEPGNQNAWRQLVYHYQENKSQQKQKEALFYSLPLSEDSLFDSFAKPYAHLMQADWILKAPLHERLFPDIYTSPSSLYLIDKRYRTLSSWSSSTGKFEWDGSIQLNNRPLKSTYYYPYIAFADEMQVQIYDLQDRASLTGSIETSGTPAAIQILQDQLLILHWNGKLQSFDPLTLELKWENSKLPPRGQFCIHKGHIVHASSNGLNLISLQDGVISQNLPLPFPPGVKVISAKDHIIAYTQRDILVFSGDNLELRWRKQMVNPVFDAYANDTLLLITTNTRNQHMYSLKSGANLWTYSNQESLFLQPSFSSAGVFLNNKNKLILLNRETGEELVTKEFPENIRTAIYNNEKLYISLPDGSIFSYPLNLFSK
jgi:outer membrane protein assembly factor BamB